MLSDVTSDPIARGVPKRAALTLGAAFGITAATLIHACQLNHSHGLYQTLA
jgi:hypothetical protein